MADEVPEQAHTSAISHADAQALDQVAQVLTQGSDSLDQMLASETDPHIRRAAQLVWSIRQSPAPQPSADLVRRTLDRIHQHQTAAPAPEQSPGPFVIPIRWSELIALAAMLVMGVSLALPVLARARADARRIACANNLATAGLAISSYAQEHNGIMPRLGNWPGLAWWKVGSQPDANGQVESNSAHLYVLASHDYINPATLACPENTAAPAHMSRDQGDWPTAQAVSYSYQNQFTADPLRVERASTLAMLADKNPLFGNATDRLRYYQNLAQDSPSRAHSRSGQNVLTGDGNVRWMTRPVVNNEDNIWLARGVQHYNGTEKPAGIDDSFLVP